MTNKRLIIENLDNLQELNHEEFSAIQGGLTLVDGYDIKLPIEERLIYPGPNQPVELYPLPEQPIKPYYPLPYIPCSPYPTKEGKLPWCAVIL
jgi:hypothetical protein